MSQSMWLRWARYAVSKLSPEEASRLLFDVEEQSHHYALVSVSDEYVHEIASELDIDLTDDEARTIASEMQGWDWGFQNDAISYAVQNELEQRHGLRKYHREPAHD